VTAAGTRRRRRPGRAGPALWRSPRSPSPTVVTTSASTCLSLPAPGIGGMSVYAVVFLVLVAAWCFAGWFFATRPVIAKTLARWGHSSQLT
jgi:hypothetical protein